MGKLIVTIGVGNQQGTRFEDIEVTVDTGATFTAVPRTLLQDLEVPVARSARSRLADGSTAPVDIGWTMIRLDGRMFPAQVTFAEENQPGLLGSGHLGGSPSGGGPRGTATGAGRGGAPLIKEIELEGV